MSTMNHTQITLTLYEMFFAALLPVLVLVPLSDAKLVGRIVQFF